MAAQAATYSVAEFSAGDTVFSEGFPAAVAYIVKEGRVQISIQRDDKEVVLNNLDRGAVFGEMALLSENGLRTATAKASVPTKLIVVDKETFNRFITECTPFIASILKAMVERLRNLTDKVAALEGTAGS